MSLRFWAVAAAFHLLVGAATIWLGLRLLHEPRAVWRRLLDLLVLAAASFAAASFFSRFLPDPPFAHIRLVAQALFGEGPLLLAWLTAAHTRRRRARAALSTGTLLLALLLVYGDAYHRTPTDLQVRHHMLDRTRSPAHGTLRVLHLSDIQVWRVGPYEARVVREAMRLRPDLILMTGDYVHTRMVGSRQGIARDLRALLRRERFGAPLGVYAVGGDTDRRSERALAGLGVRWLANEHAVVPLPGGRRLVIVGLAAAQSRRRTARAVVEAAPSGDLLFVMGHAPDFVAALPGRRRVDLALAGHTHGGQVVLPYLGPPLVLTGLPRRYAAGGLTDYHGVPLHVSRGTGMERGSAPQLRFLCPPEICLIEVRY